MSMRLARHRVRAAAGAAVLLVAVAACSGGSDSDGKPPSSSTGSSPTTSGSSTASSGDLPEGFGPGPAGQGLDRFYQQQVDWKPCDQGECARVWVPLDYAHPDGQAITIEMSRLHATEASKL